MKNIMVRYKVKADRLEENEKLVRAVYAELGEAKPEGFRYATFKLPDGVSFVHIASLSGDDNPLSKIAAFAEFQKGLRDRCDEPPTPADLTDVASYRFFGD
jgi:hypothetical protein